MRLPRALGLAAEAQRGVAEQGQAGLAYIQLARAAQWEHLNPILSKAVLLAVLDAPVQDVLPRPARHLLGEVSDFFHVAVGLYSGLGLPEDDRTLLEHPFRVQLLHKVHQVGSRLSSKARADPRARDVLPAFHGLLEDLFRFQRLGIVASVDTGVASLQLKAVRELLQLREAVGSTELRDQLGGLARAHHREPVDKRPDILLLGQDEHGVEAELLEGPLEADAHGPGQGDSKQDAGGGTAAARGKNNVSRVRSGPAFNVLRDLHDGRDVAQGSQDALATQEEE